MSSLSGRRRANALQYLDFQITYCPGQAGIIPKPTPNFEFKCPSSRIPVISHQSYLDGVLGSFLFLFALFGLLALFGFLGFFAVRDDLALFTALFF